MLPGRKGFGLSKDYARGDSRKLLGEQHHQIDVTGRREESGWPFALEVANQTKHAPRRPSGSEVHDPHAGRNFAEVGTVCLHKNQVDQEATVGEAARQTQHHPFCAARLEAGETQRDAPRFEKTVRGWRFRPNGRAT